MQKRFALIDIKGALLNYSADSAYYIEAIRNIFGLQLSALDLGRYAGMTARMTAEAILKEQGVQESMIKEKMGPFLEELQYSYNNYGGMAHIASNKSIMVGGADNTLRSIREKGVELCVVTGELERIATLNMDRAGIKGYFDIGTYGSSGRTYADLLAAALAAIKAKHGSVEKNDIFVLSANPDMIAAAKSQGLKTIAVPGPESKGLMGTETDIHTNGIKDRKIIDALTA